MEPIITSVTLGILANSLYDLMKGEGPLTGMAKYIDEHVLNRSKLFNRQTVAKIGESGRIGSGLSCFGRLPKRGNPFPPAQGEEGI